MARNWRFLDKAVNFLGGLKFSFFLLVVLGFLVAQRAIIAQKVVSLKDMPWLLEMLNSLGFASSGTLEILFYVVLSLLVVNLVFASQRMARRIIAKQRSFQRLRSADVIRGLANSIEFTALSESSSRLVGFLKRNGFKVTNERFGAENRIHASRHFMGYWGVFFFHLTFLVVLAGALLSVLTRHVGSFELSPGETFVEARKNYQRVSSRPAILGEDRGFSLRLEGIDLSYWQPWEVKQIESFVSVFTPEGLFIGRKNLEINTPLKVAGMTIYQGTRVGFVASLEAEDASGTMVPGRVKFPITSDPENRLKTRMWLPMPDFALDLELFTEKIGEIEGLEPAGVNRHMHSATLIKVTKPGPYGGYNNVLFKGGSLTVEGIILRFKQLNVFTSFLVVRDYGVPVIFFGFVLLVAGLAVNYFWVPEHYWAVVRQEGEQEIIVIGAMTEKFKQSFKERFLMQMNDLRSELLK